jgi:hypothetical protein
MRKLKSRELAWAMGLEGVLLPVLFEVYLLTRSKPVFLLFYVVGTALGCTFILYKLRAAPRPPSPPTS